MKEEGEEKGRELDFTICREENIPKELKEIIREKKEKPFQISFSNQAYMYYVIGYGVQPTFGYSILVQNIELKNGKIYVDTLLLGPEKNKKIEKKESFPYIVIKLEKREEDAVFLV
ncbi:MAG: protease complex subunit PrcB family protein [Lachnospiraceae bacterium]